MSEFTQEAPVGEHTVSAVSMLRDEQGRPAIGNVLRRTCLWAGEGACKQTCQLREVYERRNTDAEASDAVAEALTQNACADLNLLHAMHELDLEPSSVLMVGVTGNKVGFADQLEDYGPTQNPYGWRELPGFNAFFARKGEIAALGRRLADCADVNFEFEDREGKTVCGFVHGTRTNLFGSSKFAFEENGQTMSFVEYAMRQAVEHYGAAPESMRIRLSAAIQGENNIYTFASEEKKEEILPGWQEDGFARNASHPDWQPGDPVNPEDKWEADTRGIVIRDIQAAMARLGVPPETFDMQGTIDPADGSLQHSSNKTSHLTKTPSLRDAYFTVFTEKS